MIGLPRRNENARETGRFQLRDYSASIGIRRCRAIIAGSCSAQDRIANSSRLSKLASERKQLIRFSMASVSVSAKAAAVVAIKEVLLEIEYN